MGRKLLMSGAGVALYFGGHTRRNQFNCVLFTISTYEVMLCARD
jgi:hypothetical protein